MAKQHQFQIVFIEQDEGGFTVEVPELPGCISEGDTLEEAQKNIEEAISLYLETLAERKIPLPEREPSRIFRKEIIV